MEPILLVGGTGMLGCTLAPLLRSAAPVVVHGHHAQADVRADVTEPAQARALLDGVRPRAIVNLAGHTNVDACEREPSRAYRLNVRIVENIVAWIREQDSAPALVHISTDQVYDGEGPHREDAVTLTNTYAFSKYAGELAALWVPTTVLRTNFFGPSRCASRASFTDWLLGGLRGGQQLEVFEDVRFSPLSMATLGRAIGAVLRAPAAGVFNLGATSGMSKADFAFAFANEMGLPTARLERTTTDRVDSLKAYRPKDMQMDSRAFEATFGMRLPSLAQELQLTCEEYRREPAPARP